MNETTPKLKTQEQKTRTDQFLNEADTMLAKAKALIDAGDGAGANAVLEELQQNYTRTAQESGGKLTFSGTDMSERFGNMIQLFNNYRGEVKRMAATPAVDKEEVVAEVVNPAVGETEGEAIAGVVTGEEPAAGVTEVKPDVQTGDGEAVTNALFDTDEVAGDGTEEEVTDGAQPAAAVVEDDKEEVTDGAQPAAAVVEDDKEEVTDGAPPAAAVVEDDKEEVTDGVQPAVEAKTDNAEPTTLPTERERTDFNQRTTAVVEAINRQMADLIPPDQVQRVRDRIVRVITDRVAGMERAGVTITAPTERMNFLAAVLGTLNEMRLIPQDATQQDRLRGAMDTIMNGFYGADTMNVGAVDMRGSMIYAGETRRISFDARANGNLAAPENRPRRRSLLSWLRRGGMAGQVAETGQVNIVAATENAAPIDTAEPAAVTTEEDDSEAIVVPVSEPIAAVAEAEAATDVTPFAVNPDNTVTFTPRGGEPQTLTVEQVAQIVVTEPQPGHVVATIAGAGENGADLVFTIDPTQRKTLEAAIVAAKDAGLTTTTEADADVPPPPDAAAGAATNGEIAVEKKKLTRQEEINKLLSELAEQIQRVSEDGVTPEEVMQLMQQFQELAAMQQNPDTTRADQARLRLQAKEMKESIKLRQIKEQVNRQYEITDEILKRIGEILAKGGTVLLAVIVSPVIAVAFGSYYATRFGIGEMISLPRRGEQLATLTNKLFIWMNEGSRRAGWKLVNKISSSAEWALSEVVGWGIAGIENKLADAIAKMDGALKAVTEIGKELRVAVEQSWEASTGPDSAYAQIKTRVEIRQTELRAIGVETTGLLSVVVAELRLASQDESRKKKGLQKVRTILAEGKK